jgi:hypothetical protein
VESWIPTRSIGSSFSAETHSLRFIAGIQTQPTQIALGTSVVRPTARYTSAAGSIRYAGRPSQISTFPHRGMKRKNRSGLGTGSTAASRRAVSMCRISRTAWKGFKRTCECWVRNGSKEDCGCSTTILCGPFSVLRARDKPNRDRKAAPTRLCTCSECLTLGCHGKTRGACRRSCLGCDDYLSCLCAHGMVVNLSGMWILAISSR